MEKEFSGDEAYMSWDVAESFDSVTSIEPEQTAGMIDIAAGLSGLDPSDPANALALSGIVNGIRYALEDGETEVSDGPAAPASDPVDGDTGDAVIPDPREQMALEREGLRDLHALLGLSRDVLPEQLS